MFFIDIFCTIGYPVWDGSLGVDILFYLFFRCGAKFFRGERRGVESNSGYCDYSLKLQPFGYNVNIFSGNTLLVVIGLFFTIKIFWWRSYFVLWYDLSILGYEKLCPIVLLVIVGFTFICYFCYLFIFI